ncbi:MAG TPA: transposase [Anaerolineales bacterium]|jgi:transposase-like protein
MPLQTANSVVESGWREREGERSEPERERQLDSSAETGAESASAAIPNPQVLPKTGKAKRRRFSAGDKQRILEAVDQATEPGAVGRILRREGLYHAQLSKWRQQRASGISAGLAHKPRGAKGPSAQSLQQENRKLQRENTCLRKELNRAEIIIEFQKKAAALFEITKATEES